MLVIPSYTPYKREIVRWFDKWYDEQYFDLQTRGERGIHWDYDDENEDFWHLMIPNGMSETDFKAQVSYTSGLGNQIIFNEKNLFSNRQSYYDRLRYEPYVKEYMPPMLYTLDAYNSLLMYEMALSTYLSQYQAQCIVGQKNIENTFEDHIAHLNSLNLEEVLEIHQGEYNRIYGNAKYKEN